MITNDVPAILFAERIKKSINFRHEGHKTESKEGVTYTG